MNVPKIKGKRWVAKKRNKAEFKCRESRGRGSQHGEQMAAPGPQGDEQPLVGQLVAAPLVYPVIEQVGEVPAAAVQVGPSEPDPSIGGLGGEVDHDHVPAIAVGRVVSGPGPGEQVTTGVVV